MFAPDREDRAREDVVERVGSCVEVEDMVVFVVGADLRAFSSERRARRVFTLSASVRAVVFAPVVDA